MTPDEAIRAHREWKTHFLVAMTKQEQMNVAEITSDRCSPFGKWLHGHAKSRFGDLPSYQHCVEAHATFHLEAGEVAKRVNAGELHEANLMLGYGTPFAQASETLTLGVMAMLKEDESIELEKSG